MFKKRVEMEQKKKTFFNSSKLRLVSIFFAILFGVYFITINTLNILEASELSSYLNSLLNEISDYNNQNTQESANNYTNIDEGSNIPLFTDSKQAIIFAYNRFLTATSYELYSYGDIILNSPDLNLTYNGKANFRAIQFASGNQYVETIKKQTSGSIDVNFTRAAKWYFANGVRYDVGTKQISMDGNKLYATYSEGWSLNADPLAKRISFYDINLSTIISAEPLQIIYHPITKKIYQYYVTIKLHPINSTMEYKKIIKEQGGDSYARFSDITIKCILNSSGDISSMVINELYSVDANVVGRPLNINVKDTFYYSMLSLNGTVSINEPVIS